MVGSSVEIQWISRLIVVAALVLVQGGSAAATPWRHGFRSEQISAPCRARPQPGNGRQRPART
jgi:hypothetical protein